MFSYAVSIHLQNASGNHSLYSLIQGSSGDRAEDRLQWEKKRIYRTIKNFFSLFGYLHLSLHLHFDVFSFMLQQQHWLMTITYVRDAKKVKLVVPSLSFEIKLTKSFSLLKQSGCHLIEERKEQSIFFTQAVLIMSDFNLNRGN